MKLVLLLPSLISTLGVFGTAVARPALAEPAMNGTWILVRLVDARGSATPSGENVPTLTLVGTRVSGSAGCNTYFGPGVFTATTVRLGPLATTKRLCAPRQNELETRFLNVLSRVRAWSLGRDLLVLSTGTERLVFSNRVTDSQQAPQADSRALLATWRLVGAVGDTPPTLTFAAEGRVSGSTGCNNLMGTYSLDGADLRFSPLAITRRACLAEELARQEQTFLARLGRVRSFALRGSVLTLTLEEGETLTFQRSVD